jgi:hypothetical protein
MKSRTTSSSANPIQAPRPAFMTETYEIHQSRHQPGRVGGASGQSSAALCSVGRFYAHPGDATGPMDGIAWGAKGSTSQQGKTSCVYFTTKLEFRQRICAATLPHEKARTANLPLTMRSGSQPRRESSTRTSPERSCTSSQDLATNACASATPRARFARRHTSCALCFAPITANSGLPPQWTEAALTGGATSIQPARSALSSRSLNGSRGG